MSTRDPYAEFKDPKTVVAGSASTASPYDEFKDPATSTPALAPPPPLQSSSTINVTAAALPDTTQFESSMPYHQLEARRRELIEKPQKELEAEFEKRKVVDYPISAMKEMDKFLKENYPGIPEDQRSAIVTKTTAMLKTKESKPMLGEDVPFDKDVDGKPIDKAKLYIGNRDQWGNIKSVRALGQDLRQGKATQDPATGEWYIPLFDPATGAVRHRLDAVPPGLYAPTVSVREQPFVDEEGHLQAVPMTTTRTRIVPGATGTPALTTPAPTPPAPSAPQPGPQGSSVELPPTRPPAISTSTQTGAPSTPSVPVPPANLPKSGGPPRSLGDLYQPGTFNQSVKRAGPIREAYTQLFGSPETPTAPKYMDYAKVADDPEKSKLLAKAINLTLHGLEDKEKIHGSLINLLKLYAGVPSMMLGAEADATREIMGDEFRKDPQLEAAYNATMNAVANVVGLRSASGGLASETSIRKIEDETPLIGINTYSSKGFYQKMAALARVANNATKGTPTISKTERDYIQSQQDLLYKLAGGSAITPPPSSSSGTVRMKGPKGTFDVPKAKQSMFEQNGYSVVK